ncbi:unnamed protein product, partial [Scytosiphon promiscuus]
RASRGESRRWRRLVFFLHSRGKHVGKTSGSPLAPERVGRSQFAAIFSLAVVLLLLLAAARGQEVAGHGSCRRAEEEPVLPCSAGASPNRKETKTTPSFAFVVSFSVALAACFVLAAARDVFSVLGRVFVCVSFLLFLRSFFRVPFVGERRFVCPLDGRHRCRHRRKAGGEGCGVALRNFGVFLRAFETVVRARTVTAAAAAPNHFPDFVFRGSTSSTSTTRARTATAYRVS